MLRSRIAKVVTAVALVAAAATACGSEVKTFDKDTLFENHLTLKDGREVTCIIHSDYNQGGVSCDWEGATE